MPVSRLRCAHILLRSVSSFIYYDSTNKANKSKKNNIYFILGIDQKHVKPFIFNLSCKKEKVFFFKHNEFEKQTFPFLLCNSSLRKKYFHKKYYKKKNINWFWYFFEKNFVDKNHLDVKFIGFNLLILISLPWKLKYIQL